MDKILSCSRCTHAIGTHAADGCTCWQTHKTKCACTFTPYVIIEDELKRDELRRSHLFSRFDWVEHDRL